MNAKDFQSQIFVFIIYRVGELILEFAVSF